jgi:hypothetical protein
LTPTVHVTSASATLRLTVTTVNAACSPSVYDDVVLTVKPTSAHTTTAEACDSYTWAAPGNGQTYTASGTYTYVTPDPNGCDHTETLNLTITTSSTNTTTASACDSYTWPVNNQTYTATGIYDVVTGCHTERLDLTITPSSINSTNASACDSYTWSVNNQTYTASGTYDVVSGCHTERLNLTITASTTTTTTASGCDSYTWAVNNQTYTAGGTYDVVSGCHTERLILTIKVSPAAPVLSIADNCGSSVITAKDGTGALIPAGELTWSNGATGNPITVMTVAAITATRTVNGCPSGNSNSVTPVGGTCSHIFPTATTCCNYVNGPTSVFQFKQVCITPTYGVPAGSNNKVGNAIPGVFFYYGDYTATTSGSKTVVIGQTYTPSGILAPFNAKNLNFVHVTDTKCNNIAIKSVSYDKVGGVATVVFTAVAGTKYVISVKYDTKSIIGTKLPNGKPLSGAVATYTFGMSVGGTAVPGSTGSIKVTVGCTDNTPLPTGACPLLSKPANPEFVQATTVTKLAVSAYPNPFTDKVQFNIVSPVSGKASLDVYNVMGQKVGNVYNGYLHAGRSQVIDYNVAGAKGSLIYTLKVGDKQVNGKVIHLK